jgi:hypothetical protein
MATTIHVERLHNLGLDEAKVRGHKLLDRFADKLSHLINDTTWNEDGTEGTAAGKLFSAHFTLTDDKVGVDVELRGLGAKFLKGQIETQVQRSLEKWFT